jgi:hypothetical protein
LAQEFKRLLQPKVPRDKAKEGILRPCKTRVRPLLCSPERWLHRNNQPWFASGSEMFSYLGKCLNPQEMRSACATRYDYDLWGAWLSRLVRYFSNGHLEIPGRYRTSTIG